MKRIQMQVAGRVPADVVTWAPMLMGVRVTRAGECSVLRVSGEIDMATAPELRFALVEEINEGCALVVVDLADVDFVDSTGLGVLLGGLVRARRLGGDLRVTGLSHRLVEVFDLVGLHAVLAAPDPETLALLVSGAEGDTG